MKLLKLPVGVQDGKASSIDISCDGTKVATSGKAGGIEVWFTEEIAGVVDDLQEKSSNGAERSEGAHAPEGSAAGGNSGGNEGEKATQAAVNGEHKVADSARSSDIESTIRSLKAQITLGAHGTAVECVRWSPIDGNLLVSGDVGGKVYLQNCADETATLLYPFSQSNQLSGIVDLSWSKDGRLLAWSSSDGKVHIYDVTRKTYQDLTSLSHPEKTVVHRSIAFDPTNNFFVSLDDETLVYVYQYRHDFTTNNYQFRLLNKVSKLINKNVLVTKYKRISWSPDGEYVAIPSANKSATSIISLLSCSQKWQNRISLVGHDHNCEVVKFNPKIYTVDANNSQLFNIVASAGSDKTLAVWNTSKDYPIVVLKDLEDHIVDICWDYSGNRLYAVSSEGNLIVLSFSNDELGIEISSQIWSDIQCLKQESLKPLNHKYENEQISNKKTAAQIELLDQCDSVDTTKELDSPEKGVSSISKETEENNTQGTNVESVTTVKGDIVPEVLSPEPSGSSQSPNILQTAMTNRQGKQPQKAEKTKSQNKVPVLNKAVESKNGKKRVQPTLISKNWSDDQKAIEPRPASSSLQNGNNVSKSLMEFDKPSYSVSEGFAKKSKRQKSDDVSSSKKFKRELEPIKFIGSVLLNPNTTFSKVRLSAPKLRMSIYLESKNNDGSQLVLDVKNGSGNEVKPSRITCLRKEKQVWSDFIPKFIQLASEGKSFWALSTADGHVLVYETISGRRIMPPVILGSPVSFLEAHQDFLMAVTSIGELYVWNIAMKKMHLTANMAPLLDISNKYADDGISKADNITMCSITTIGIPLVTLSNGSGYLFNKDLVVWQTITESWWAFGSHYWDSVEGANSQPQSQKLLDNDASLIYLLENKTNDEIIRRTRTGRGKYFNKISKNMVMKEGFESLENTISISHLENRILCAEILEEKTDFKRFLIAYSKRVCELGMKNKLFDICSQLFGPVGDNDNGEGENEVWIPHICGINKHELLKEVILSCAEDRDSQRILIHFGNKIGLIDSEIVP